MYYYVCYYFICVAMITTEVTQQMIQSNPSSPVTFSTSNNVTDTTVTIATSTMQATTSASVKITSQTEQISPWDRGAVLIVFL